MSMGQIRLSPTAIKDLKANPEKYRLRYVEGLVPIEDTDSSRVGTNWHELHETYNDAVKAGHPDPYARVMEVMNEVYEHPPASKTAEEWALERMILAVSFTGYLHYWANFSTTETVATELPFELPLYHPRGRPGTMPLPKRKVVRVGKIDHLETRPGHKRLLVRDYKSTSSDISAGSDYWTNLRLDTQISSYISAVEDMLRLGMIPGTDESWTVGGAMLDVWHKPTIRPKALTQKATAEFLETKGYFDMEFEVTLGVVGENGIPDGIWVDGEKAIIEEGKRGFAIRETVGLYGARLASDIAENPAKYFARREIARTEKDRVWFRTQLYNIYRVIQFMRDNDCWFVNEQDDRYPCKYMKLIQSGVDLSPGVIPDGFKKLEWARKESNA